MIDDVTEPIKVDGIGDIPAIPGREIIAQKIYYRAGYFKGRDLFDFSVVAKADPSMLQDVRLRQVAGIRKDALAGRLDAAGLGDEYSAVFFDEAKQTLSNWLAEIDIEH